VGEGRWRGWAWGRKDGMEFMGILREVSDGHGIEDIKERPPCLVENRLEMADADDRAGVVFGVEALGEVAGEFGVANHFAYWGFGGMRGEEQSTAGAAGGDQPTAFGEKFCHFGEVMERDGIGFCDFARADFPGAVRHQINEESQGVVCVRGQLHGGNRGRFWY
jgi:hypothetical protein